ASAGGSDIATAAYSAAAKTTSVLPLKTLAPKCVWSNKEKTVVYCGVPTIVPSGTYPDDWYKGIAHFADKLWKINVKTQETDLILDPAAETLSDIDMTNLTIDPTDSFIAFTNKTDMSLWLYRIK
ncbi:hypothetical protein KW799_01730, partial [Candidatus Parcubacteria bacterium]|nr:hypothetical protein [Candidatus Parcubacteria bacterium]